MDEQELRNFLGGDYPSDLTYQRILKERVESFPGALEVYQPDPNGIIYNRDSWFLVTQLMPSLVTDYGESPDSHLIDFINGPSAYTADWVSIYKFFDLYMHNDEELADILNEHRDELLSGYDIV